ncbi:hypothetical protein LZ554_003329 [Drepanopeziza brunnea f. sp. 'monogermtubi']|nr:hypothetical protein LZ554_003329 [Drepanopeziza brunnea f. sp. 'monogermtubi']
MRSTFVTFLALCTVVTPAVAAVNLYASSYSGAISSLSLSLEASGGYRLNTPSVVTEAGTSPSWLEKNDNVLYMTDEGFSGLSYVSSYSTSESEELTFMGRGSTLSGPVSSVVYNGGKGLAVAHYSGSATTSWNIRANGTLVSLQNLTFTGPLGTNSERQEAPHPHQTIVDPTDSFILVPDLGSDLVRVFSIEKSTSALTETTPLVTPPGSGPRHGAFMKAACGNTYLFVIYELSNSIASYKVSYSGAHLAFEEVFMAGTYGPTTTPAGAAAAEVILSPDNKFLLTSSRNDSLFQIPSFEPGSTSELIDSDTLQSWAIDDATGMLTFVQLAPAGGKFPRHFSLNKAGTLAAVGLQRDGMVVVMERDVASGKFGKFVASVPVEGEVNTVIWDE